jgi:hypothetical protein
MFTYPHDCPIGKFCCSPDAGKVSFALFGQLLGSKCRCSGLIRIYDFLVRINEFQTAD